VATHVRVCDQQVRACVPEIVFKIKQILPVLVEKIKNGYYTPNEIN